MLGHMAKTWPEDRFLTPASENSRDRKRSAKSVVIRKLVISNCSGIKTLYTKIETTMDYED